MKIKRIISAVLILSLMLCLFGCGSVFSPEKIECIMGNSPELLSYKKLEFDDGARTVTAVMDDGSRIVFPCERKTEYDGFKFDPDILRVYKMDVNIRNRSGYIIRDVKPYMKRQWDMLSGDSFETAIPEIKAHSKTVTAYAYALTDFNISVIKSGFVDNVFEISYSVYSKEDFIGKYFTKFLYE